MTENETEDTSADDSAVKDGQETASESPKTDPLLPFIEALSARCNEEQRYRKLRATPRGLFISDDVLDEIVKQYISWSSETTSIILQPEKALKKLLGEGTPSLHYLLDGKVTLVGYMAPVSLAPSKKIQIPFFQGSLINAQDYLHMRDPLFEELENVKPFTGTTGFRIEMSSKNGSLILSHDIVIYITTLILQSPVLVKRYPSVQSALRNTLPIIAKIWNESRPSADEDRYLVPPGFRKKHTGDIFRWSEIILIRDKEQQLAFCYGLKGKSFRGFLSGELRKLSRKGKQLKVKNFHFGGSKGIYGSVQAGKDSLRVFERTVKEFAQHVSEVRELLEILPHRYTGKDILDTLVKLLSGSSWVEGHALPKQALEDHGTKGTYRKKGDWIFIFGKNLTLEAVFHPKFSRQRRKKTERRS